MRPCMLCMVVVAVFAAVAAGDVFVGSRQCIPIDRESGGRSRTQSGCNETR